MKKSNHKLWFVCSSVLVSLFILFDFTYASKIYNYFYNNSAHRLDPISFGSTVFTILRWFGYAAAVCVTLIVGIQFMTASSQKKAQLKEKLWLIGVSVLLLAAGVPLLQIVFDMIMQLRKNITVS